MSTTSGQLLSKPPAERTFVIAVTLLSIVAVIQVAAVLVAVIPGIRFEQTASAAPQSASAPAEPTQAAPPQAPTQEAMIEAAKSYQQAINLQAQGKLEESLAALDQANRLYPHQPGFEATIGLTLQYMGRNEEAAQYLKTALSNPQFQQDPTYARLAAQAQSALAQLGNGAFPPSSAAPASAATQASQSSAPSAPPPDANASGRMRDEVGIPIGSVVGIVDVRLRDGDPGTKKLRVDTKGSVKEQIDPKELRTMVYFFEQNDHGDISQTQSTVMSEWLSPPVDWQNGDPELLEVTYPMPKGNRGDLPPLQYYGYMVGVYYKGELQDFRAEPASLAEEFPLKYSLGSGE